ncbi:hypothetical protein WJX81_007623 [Elliptochloris bilobata]|uniref:holo-[acyl-carrier-protein] synthase n=1 Tax=Elliptochloris bilobata TaxID=381761 RepID=A0AAW1RI15_9CHLO
MSEGPVRLAPGEVHIWWLFPEDVTDDGLLARYQALLTTAEREHVAAAANALLRRERLLARALVRTVLARYCGLAPQALVFERGRAGKPELCRAAHPAAALPGGRRLRFNLSHTPSLLGCAVAVDAAVGLDVEEAERMTRSDPLRLARRRFSAAEAAALERVASPSERAAHFVRLWTLKEAYVKAVGRGIDAPPGLRGFTVSLEPVEDVPIVDPFSRVAEISLCDGLTWRWPDFNFLVIAAPAPAPGGAAAGGGPGPVMDDFRPVRAAVLGPSGQPLAHHVPPPPAREEPALLPLSFDLSCKHDRTVPFQCQVMGCSALLEIPYYRRRRLCKDHANRLELIHHGVPFRFCQQHGCFHQLDVFDGNKKSCRERLMKHNENRRKGAKNGPSARGRPLGALGEGFDPANPAPGSGSLSGDCGLLGGGSGELPPPRVPKAGRGSKRPRAQEGRGRGAGVMQPLLLRSGNFSASPSPDASAAKGPARRRRRRPASAAGWRFGGSGSGGGGWADSELSDSASDSDTVSVEGASGAVPQPRARGRRSPAFARPAAARTRNYSKRTLMQGGVRTVYLEEHVPRHYCAALARVLRVQHGGGGGTHTRPVSARAAEAAAVAKGAPAPNLAVTPAFWAGRAVANGSGDPAHAKLESAQAHAPGVFRVSSPDRRLVGQSPMDAQEDGLRGAAGGSEGAPAQPAGGDRI